MWAYERGPAASRSIPLIAQLAQPLMNAMWGVEGTVGWGVGGWSAAFIRILIQ